MAHQDNLAETARASEAGGLNTHDGLRLYTRRWRPEGAARAVVLILHGLAEHGERHAPLAEALAAQGYAVEALDLRGHGRSEGAWTYVDDFEDYVRDLDALIAEVRSHYPGLPLFIFGHSMGGTIAALWTITRHPALAGLILSSPAARLWQDDSLAVRLAMRVVSFVIPKAPTIPLRAYDISRDPEVVRDYDRDPLVYRGGVRARTGYELSRAARHIRERAQEIDAPLLVLQGTADRLVHPEGAAILHRSARSEDKTLKLYEGLYHETLHEPEQQTVLADLLAWLEAHTPAMSDAQFA
jgi:alpha-beta hydrolase superfamily lysophospholipase